MPHCQQCRRSLESELVGAPGTIHWAVLWYYVYSPPSWLLFDVLFVECGAVLGESYVLLPTASASQSMLLLQKLPASTAMPLEMDESGVFGEDLYASARYNLSLQQQHQQEQRRQQAQRRQKLQQRQRHQQQKLRDSYTSAAEYLDAHVRHASHEKESPAMDDSVVAVPTYADLSHHVQLLTTQQAHWYGHRQ